MLLCRPTSYLGLALELDTDLSVTSLLECSCSTANSDEFELEFPELSQAELKVFRTMSSLAEAFLFSS